MNFREEESREIEREWQRFLYRVKPFFKRKPNLQTVLFLIGVQEVGALHHSFSKEEKQDLMHIGLCNLLMREDYYRFDGRDADGWPHYSKLKDVPMMELDKRETWLKSLALAYFADYEKGNFSLG